MTQKPGASARTSRKSISGWDRAKRAGEIRAWITAYDFAFARLAQAAGIDGLLIGDSLGMTVQGERDTLRVTLDQMIYHTSMVARGAPQCMIMADLPFGTFEADPAQAFASSVELMKAGADIIKLEGGAAMAETVAFLSARAVPICAHIGLTPQHVRQFGGFKRQGTTEEGAVRLIADADALIGAGARMLLMEAMPATLAAEITRRSPIPTIGIGAGPDTDAQILVLHDVLGLDAEYAPAFAKRYLDGAGLITSAIGSFADEVRNRAFPPRS